VALEPEGSSPCSPHLTTGPCPEPVESNPPPSPQPISLSPFWYYPPIYVFWVVSFLWAFPPKPCTLYLVSKMLGTCHLNAAARMVKMLCLKGIEETRHPYIIMLSVCLCVPLCHYSKGLTSSHKMCRGHHAFRDRPNWIRLNFLQSVMRWWTHELVIGE
jgi:hypothetical protein